MSKDNITSIPNTDVDPEEYSAALTDAEKVMSESQKYGQYIVAIKDTFEYMGKSYNELTFDFNTLKGQDCLDISAELALRGVTLVAPEFSMEYQRLFATKACLQKLPSDAYLLMPAKTFQRIVKGARSFLLLAE